MEKPLTLLFDPFETIVLFLSVLIVDSCIDDGRSNWLEGMILMSLYVLLCILNICLCGYIGCCVLEVSSLVSPIRPTTSPA